jgi:predicted nucleic acid-binding protein
VTGAGASSPYLAEPPASYLVRPPIVVDCSVLSAASFDEPLRDDAERLLVGKTLYAPDLIDYEIANVAGKKRRLALTAGLSPEEAQAWLGQSLERYLGLELQRSGIDLRDTVALAERYQLSAYDASYLWLAAELKAPLVTFDAKLADAARRHLSTLK